MDWIILIEIIILFILPVLLLYFKIISFKYRLVVLNAVVFAVLAIVFLENWSLLNMGIRHDNLSVLALPYLFFIVLGVLLLLFLAGISGVKPRKEWWKTPQFGFRVIAISVLQEFIFRSFLLERLGSLFTSLTLIILANALLFALAHIIFSAKPFHLLVVFFWGIAFATMYTFYPNLLLISLAHIIFNFVVVVYEGVFISERPIHKRLKGEEENVTDI